MHSANTAVASKLRPLSFCFFSPSLIFTTHRPVPATRTPDFYSNISSTSIEQFRGNFVDALVRAGSCKRDRSSRKRKDGVHRQCQSSMAVQKHSSKGTSAVTESWGKRGGGFRKRVRYTQDEYRALLDYYRTVDDNFGIQVSRTKQDLAHNSEEDIPSTSDSSGLPPGQESPLPPENEGEDASALVEKLWEVLTSDASPEDVFEAYSRLPRPGVTHLTTEQRKLLRRRLSILQHKNALRTMNYFSMLDDYRAAGMRIPRHAWNSALHLGGTSGKRVNDADIELTLRAWKQMESEAPLRSNGATFNILLNVAGKAGKFALSDMVMQEMRKRDLKLTRFTLVTMMHNHGIRGDGDGIRETYRELVDNGEIVDTVVLNCVVNALLTAGEPSAAEAVFYRMKNLAAEKEGKTYAPRSAHMNRELGRFFAWVQAHRQHIKESARQVYQATASLAPNVRTCNHLLRHFSSAGELHRAASILDEMEAMRIAPNNETFRVLVNGFAVHGGVRYSTWTAQRLESVWQSYTASLQVEELGLYVTKNMVGRTLAAFRKCCGARRETEIWEEMKELDYQFEAAFEDDFPRPMAM